MGPSRREHFEDPMGQRGQPRRDRGLALGPGLVLGLLGLGLTAFPALAAPASAPDRFDTVVVDAGHGGEDDGARGPAGLREKDLVLDVARRLTARLEADGLRVVMTRREDRFVPLDERTALANDASGDLFISIHANAAPSRRARGVETFFLSLEASDAGASELARKENAALRAVTPASAGGPDPLLDILGDLIHSEHMRESDEFARLAQHELSGGNGSASRGVKQAPFVVLMGVQMPAALVEIGFLSNPREEHALASADRRAEIAEALAQAVREFRRRHDARRNVDGANGVAGAGGGR